MRHTAGLLLTRVEFSTREKTERRRSRAGEGWTRRQKRKVDQPIRHTKTRSILLYAYPCIQKHGCWISLLNPNSPAYGHQLIMKDASETIQERILVRLTVSHPETIYLTAYDFTTHPSTSTQLPKSSNPQDEFPSKLLLIKHAVRSPPAVIAPTYRFHSSAPPAPMSIIPT